MDARESAPSRRSASSPRVLIVDDDEGIRAALRDLLGDEGFQVVGEADDGARGVRMVEETDPDVVLMDLRMPGMGGKEAAGLIRRLRPTVQVVILTVYDDPSITGDAGETGAYAYLIKGCPPGLIRDVVHQAWRWRMDLRAREAAEGSASG